ncbi:hypothetical protein OIV83_000275 [Microbotryomycetes sp. JL201]|nr:hypothetical protein OIV83_000275 [Microbotryomycetes sp. JL201]
MDQLMNFGKQAYSQYQASQQGHQGQGGGEFGQLGSAALNSSDNNRPPQTGMPFDPSQAVQHASNATSSGDKDLFSSAMSFLNNNFDDKDDLNEDDAVKAHEQVYSNQGAQQLGSQQMGAAAAMQALKKFTSGSNEASMGSSSGGGSFQTKLVALAMAEAAKLFDSKPAANGNKQDVVQSAAATMMKLLLKNKTSGMMGAGSEGGSAMGGGGGAGGMSQLLGMAQQFMK